MKKYTFLLVVALAIAGVPSAVLGQNLGLKIASSSELEPSNFKSIVTSNGFVGVKFVAAPFDNIEWKGNLFLVTTDNSLGNAKTTNLNVTSGSLIHLEEMSDGSYLLLAFKEVSPDTFKKVIHRTPEIVKISQSGVVLWKQTYAEFTQTRDLSVISSLIQINGRIKETNNNIVCLFNGVLFSVSKKDGALGDYIDFPISNTPLDLKINNNRLVVIVRQDSMLTASKFTSKTLEILSLSNFSTTNQTLGSVSFESLKHFQLSIPINSDFTSIKTNIRVFSDDSFELVLYNKAKREELNIINVCSTHFTNSTIKVPFLLSSRTNIELKYSEKNKYYYFTAITPNITPGDEYKYWKMLVSSNLLDTLFILNEVLSNESEHYSGNVSEMSDGSFLISSNGKNFGENTFFLQKVARVPFKVPAIVVADNIVEFATPFPDGGAKIDNFQVWYKTEHGQWIVDECTKNTYQPTKIQSDSTYTVKVRAHNIAGWGEFSNEATLYAKNVGVKNINVQTLTVFPNPLQSGSTLTINSVSGGKCKIFSLNGKMIFSGDFSSNQIRLPDLSIGMYIVTVQSNEIIYQTKIIIN